MCDDEHTTLEVLKGSDEGSQRFAVQVVGRFLMGQICPQVPQNLPLPLTSRQITWGLPSNVSYSSQRCMGKP